MLLSRLPETKFHLKLCAYGYYKKMHKKLMLIKQNKVDGQCEDGWLENILMGMHKLEIQYFVT